ncbi:amino acid adenylation domain-containing protein [Nonomuraea glycinis]|uniref:non-ribosomal peptide synthetase n=1 Tax=Nonomuraea glycinis TaxID=2047744 RepID=UPI001CDA3334|nr:non-ribosomal peptide synthetase [Nonomuraea glycinis]MCA2177489.1 amino acid adenylation domain-containing protein [Nonomuraea glycinis]
MDGVRERLARLSPQQRAALEARLARSGNGRPARPRDPRDDGPPSIPRRSGAAAPLSDAQRRLWLVDQLDPGNPAYTLSWAYKIEGDLDAAALAAAFDALVERHPILGYVIDARDGEPHQLPGPVRPALLVETLPTAEADAAARHEARFRFDLSTGPLTRARLIHVTPAPGEQRPSGPGQGPQEHLLVLTVHHILADRWSVAILFEDLLRLYAGDPLTAVPVAYADYVAWRAERPQSSKEDLDHWRQALQGLPDVLDLPADRPRPPARTNEGRRLLFDLDKRLADDLREFAAGQRATPFMVLVAGLQALLARYTGQPDIPLGTPMSARPYPSLDQTVGLFLNTVVLRGDLSGDPTFTELVRRTRERVLTAFDHASVPFETLVDDLATGRDLSRNPLFQVMIAYQSTPALPGDSRGLRLERLDVRPGTAMFDLDLIVEERPDGGLLCVLDYATDLFDDDRIERLAAHLRTLLTAAVADPALPLSRLPLMGPGELHRTLRTWNDTTLAHPERGIHELVADQAARTPTAVAVEGPDGSTLTYAELESRAAALADRLGRLGVTRETRVGVCLPRDPGLLVALLAVLKAGGCYVPLDPAYPPNRLTQILTDSAATLVLTATPFTDRLPANPPLLLLDHPDTLHRADQPDHPDPQGRMAARAFHLDQAAYLIYTSGSTGRPKGVVVPHRGLVSLLSDVRTRPGLAPGARYLFLTSVSFDIAMIEIYGPLVTGGTVVIASTADIDRVHHLIQHGDLHTVQTTPSVLEGLLPALAHGGVPRVVSTGEALPGPLAARLLKVTGELWDLYGPTETTVWSTRLQVTDGTGGSIGTPVANTTAYVVDRDLHPVPIGVPGELLLGGVGVTRGYHGRAGLTAERFVPDPFGGGGGRLYRTGDLVRWCADGSLEYLGRLDDQVKVRGVRIELDEVASVLGEHPLVGRAVVAVREDAPGGRGLVAYVVPAQGDDVPGGVVRADDNGPGSRDAQDREAEAAAESVREHAAGVLRGHLRARLPEAMIPAAFVLVDDFPVLPSGKLNRAALPPPPMPSTGGPRLHPPRTPAESTLHAIWTELLQRDDIGTEDDFFALGGHSLLAMRLVVRLRDKLGAEVSLRQCFETPTIAGLADLITARTGATMESSFAKAAGRARDGQVPPSHAQARLWFLDQLDPGNPAYNVAWAEHLTGPLDPDAMTAAFDALVDRHEALRLVIVAQDGEPLLREGQHRPRLSVRDLSSSPEPPGEGPGTAESGGDQRAATDQEPATDHLVTSDRPPAPGVVVIGREEARRRFELGEGPLVRALLVRSGPGEHDLFLTLHHVIADRWSLSILLRDLMELYRAQITGTPAELPELAAGYRDFAVWHRERVSGRAADLAYWKDALADAPATLDLPADRHRQGLASLEGRRLTFTIDAETVAAVRACALERQVTPFMVLLAAFQAVLARYTGRYDIPVGTPVSGRAHPEVEEIAGLFLNTLVLRGDLSGEPSFAELLRRTRDRVLDAHDHAELPFEVLVQELAEERDLARNPLFQVMLAYQNVPPSPPEVAGIGLRTLDIDPGVTQADLHLVVEEADERLAGVLHYATDLFDHDRMERFADHFRAFLAAAVADPERPVADVPILTPAELTTILHANDTTTTFGYAISSAPAEPVTGPAADGQALATLPALVAEQALRTPYAPALGFETPQGGCAWLTYEEFTARVNRLARRLRALGAGPDQVVGVCLERGPELVIAVHAVVAAGAAYLPLEPDHPADRLAGMLADAGARLAISTGGHAARLPNEVTAVLLDRDAEAVVPDRDAEAVVPDRDAEAVVPDRDAEAVVPDRDAEAVVPDRDGEAVVRDRDGEGVVLDRDAEAVVGAESGPVGVPIHPDSLAYVIFTSGSTGRPKGVGVSHRAIVNRLRWMQDVFRLTTDDRVLHKTPFSFDVSVWELFWPLMTGAGLVVARPGGQADPAYLAGLLGSEAVTTAHFVPSMLDAFLAEPGLDERLGGLRTVICSGEALGADLADRFAAALPRAGLHNLYGPTEAAVDVSWHACRPGEPAIPIGRPVANTRLEILDERLNRVPIGVPGELWIGGVQLARGYAGRPGLTAERFVPDPHGPPGGRLYDTGDLARWRPDGEIEYLGRSDHQVKIRGMRVELGEIETALTGLPGVRAAAVRAVRDGAGLRLAGYVVPEKAAADHVVTDKDTQPGGGLAEGGTPSGGGRSAEDVPAGRDWAGLLRDRLPDHMIPRTWTVLDALPLNRSGKLDRNALPDPRAPRATVHAEPEGAAELAVAAAWRGVLGLDQVSAHDNFFAVGGDSIRSLKVVARLREAGYAVRLEQLFLHQTVRELAGRLLPAQAAERPEAAPAAFGLLNPEDLARMLEGEKR